MWWEYLYLIILLLAGAGCLYLIAKFMGRNGGVEAYKTSAASHEVHLGENTIPVRVVWAVSAFVLAALTVAAALYWLRVF